MWLLVPFTLFIFFKKYRMFFFIFIIYKLILFYNFYLFWLCWLFLAVWAFPLVVADRGYSLVVVRRLVAVASLGAQALGSRASAVAAHWPWAMGASIAVAHGLSRSTARGIFLDQGSNPCPLHWQADSYPLHHQGSPGVVKF